MHALRTCHIQVNADMMSRAGKDCLFMHCLPAERGRECTDDVIEGPQSVVWDQVGRRMCFVPIFCCAALQCTTMYHTQAENRMHAQNGVMIHSMGLA